MTISDKIEKLEIYTKVSLESVRVTDHAIDRAIERFKLGKNRDKAKSWITSKFRFAKFITQTNGQYGAGRLFTVGGIGFILEIESDLILTVYSIEAPKEVKNDIMIFIQNKIQSFSRKLDKTTRKHDKQIAKLNVEKTGWQEKILYMRSEAKMNTVRARINAIDIEITILKEEIFELETKKSAYIISQTAMFNT
ncbi:hypothetical protein ACI2JA_03215 [Alkalihalobacillus sp. NPDC078783]